MTGKTVRTDSRGRLSLGEYIQPDTYYLVREHGGVITLEKAVVLTHKELEDLQQGLRESAAGETVELGSFAHYVKDI